MNFIVADKNPVQHQCCRLKYFPTNNAATRYMGRNFLPLLIQLTTQNKNLKNTMVGAENFLPLQIHQTNFTETKATSSPSLLSKRKWPVPIILGVNPQKTLSVGAENILPLPGTQKPTHKNRKINKRKVTPSPLSP